MMAPEAWLAGWAGLALQPAPNWRPLIVYGPAARGLSFLQSEVAQLFAPALGGSGRYLEKPMAVDARRNPVRITDEEKKLLDLARTTEPLPPPVSDALLRLVEHARNGGAVLNADTDGAVRNRMIRLKDGDDRPFDQIMAMIYPELACAIRDDGAGSSPPPAGFKVGDIVQFKSGGHAMMVEDCECCGCYALIYSRTGRVEQVDVPGSCLQLYDPAADRRGDGPDIPF